MKKGKWYVAILAGILIIGAAWYITTPRYVIIQADRAITLNGATVPDFVISPAKIKMTNLWWGRPLVFKVKVQSAAYVVHAGIPAIYDEGYVATDGTDYSIATKTVGDTITVYVSKNKAKQPMREASFAVQEQSDNGSAVNISRTYIMEILLP